MEKIRLALHGSSLKLSVHTNAPVTKITGFDESNCSIKLDVHAIPEQNKANIEILKFFKKEFKIKTKIISGFTSKHKILKILNNAE